LSVAESQRAAGSPLPSPDAVMAQAKHENFPVASRLLPRAVRRDLLALYGFARLVDEIGDELPGDRLAALDVVEAELELVFDGEPANPIMRRLVPTVREHAIPREPFQRLIAANRQDQTVASYETIDDLLAYCELSANPVGRLVLHVLGAASPGRLRLSDSVCSGLQLIEHWQDVVEDLDRGRVYVPMADLARFGCVPDDLRRRPAPPSVHRLMAFEAARARGLLESGPTLVGTLRGRAALGLAAIVAGGRAALRELERAGFDPAAGKPRRSRAARLTAFIATLREAKR
jgi:squalene synthase HpnC